MISVYVNLTTFRDNNGSLQRFGYYVSPLSVVTLDLSMLCHIQIQKGFIKLYNHV